MVTKQKVGISSYTKGGWNFWLQIRRLEFLVTQKEVGISGYTIGGRNFWLYQRRLEFLVTQKKVEFLITSKEVGICCYKKEGWNFWLHERWLGSVFSPHVQSWREIFFQYLHYIIWFLFKFSKEWKNFFKKKIKVWK